MTDPEPNTPDTVFIIHSDDRDRLLTYEEMNFTTYSCHKDPQAIAASVYRNMIISASLLGLGLTEPVYDIGPADTWGGRYICVRAGVFDLVRH